MNRVNRILDRILEDCNNIEDFIKGLTLDEFLESVLIKKAVTIRIPEVAAFIKQYRNNRE